MEMVLETARLGPFLGFCGMCGRIETPYCMLRRRLLQVSGCLMLRRKLLCGLRQTNNLNTLRRRVIEWVIWNGGALLQQVLLNVTFMSTGGVQP
ncbi:hypothetical protein F2Q70_00030201 [Brassica cretica]|uniref:Uncharacterized protein n=1 Tax=Brassica cretica TaxID=69181 RepID=A0A8S9FJ03_BRACR|nr:hypothetical protein F2Q70_00030201 [Brassica cretica]KAF2552203.1 hypothetical protein F2Q68_00034673 [Brassica cretica]